MCALPLFELCIGDGQYGRDVPTSFIANECLANQKCVVLWRVAWKASRENDGDKDLNHVARDRRNVKLRHVGFEMPSAFIVLLEASCDRVGPSGFHTP